jgi:phosphoglycolate phosphatase
MRGPLAGVAVLFDLDGTLIDTAGDLAASMNHVLENAGCAPVPAPRVRHLVGHGARAMLKGAFAENGAPAPDETALDAHVEAFIAHYRAHIAVHSRPFPGAVAAIEALKQDGAAIAICTNKREALARALIESLGLEGHFAAIVGADSAGAAKPDPHPLRLCLDLTKRDRGVFVGDSDTDIKAAAAMNMPCLAARFGYGPLDLLGDAYADFSTYDEAAALVRRAAASI